MSEELRADEARKEFYGWFKELSKKGTYEQVVPFPREYNKTYRRTKDYSIEESILEKFRNVTPEPLRYFNAKNIFAILVPSAEWSSYRDLGNVYTFLWKGICPLESSGEKFIQDYNSSLYLVKGFHGLTISQRASSKLKKEALNYVEKKAPAKKTGFSLFNTPEYSEYSRRKNELAEKIWAKEPYHWPADFENFDLNITFDVPGNHITNFFPKNQNVLCLYK